MSPIENVVPNLVDNSTNQNVELRNKQDRSRDLFGVQLEVTSLLLEAERRKLSVLQKELQVALEEGGSIKAKEHQKQELLVAITRIQAQHDHLDKEYREHALGALLSANTRGSGKSNRSQPAIGLKHTPKSRPTIFGTVASDLTPKDCSNRRSLPQTPQTKSFSAVYNGEAVQENATDIALQQDNVR
jgi:hypothetical protein